MKKPAITISLDPAFADLFRAEAKDEHLSFAAVLNRALWRATKAGVLTLPPAAPTAAPTAAPPAAPTAAPPAAPTAAPDDEAWKKWKAIPEPKDAAEALALCKAAGMDMNYINETNARLAWTLYMETGDM